MRAVILVSDFHYNVSLTSRQRRLNDGPKNITMSAWQADSADSTMGQRTLQCQPDKQTVQTQRWAKEHYNVSLTSRQRRLNDGPKNITMSAWQADSRDSMMGQRTDTHFKCKTCVTLLLTFFPLFHSTVTRHAPDCCRVLFTHNTLVFQREHSPDMLIRIIHTTLVHLPEGV